MTNSGGVLLTSVLVAEEKRLRTPPVPAPRGLPCAPVLPGPGLWAARGPAAGAPSPGRPRRGCVLSATHSEASGDTRPGKRAPTSEFRVQTDALQSPVSTTLNKTLMKQNSSSRRTEQASALECDSPRGRRQRLGVETPQTRWTCPSLPLKWNTARVLAPTGGGAWGWARVRRKERDRQRGRERERVEGSRSAGSAGGERL